MKMLVTTTLAFLAFFSSLSACEFAAGYQQCGGRNHSGPTICEVGYHCERLNDYFSQCLPGQATIISSPTRIQTGAAATWTGITGPEISTAAGAVTPLPLRGEGSRSVRIARNSVQEVGPMRTIRPVPSLHFTVPEPELQFHVNPRWAERPERESLFLSLGTPSHI